MKNVFKDIFKKQNNIPQKEHHTHTKKKNRRKVKLNNSK